MILPSVTKNKLYVLKIHLPNFFNRNQLGPPKVNIIKKDVVANLVQNVQSSPSFGRG